MNRSTKTPALVLSVLFAVGSSGCRAAAPTTAPATTPATVPTTVLIHLPGIAGEMGIDHALTDGLVAGGVAPEATIFDWTGPDRGVPALINLTRHKEQSKRLADRLTTIARTSPATPIVLTAHSGGTGVAVEALERLPTDVRIDTLVLLASALSPDYDLSKALSHVRRQAVSFHSEYDNVVLGTGTRTFGTYDRQRVDAAGYVGFTQPKSADPAAYAKLTQYPYDATWMKFGNHGDHIGWMSRAFARRVLAPIVIAPASK